MVKLIELPMWYYFVATIISLYYAYRGFIGNKILFEQMNVDPKIVRQYRKWEYLTVYCTGDAIFHFVCSITGFYSLAFATYISNTLSISEIGNSIIIVSLFLFSFLGVTGQLPQLIQQGKLPWISK